MICALCKATIIHFVISERGIDFCSWTCCEAVFPNTPQTDEGERVHELRRKAGPFREYAEGSGAPPTMKQVQAFIAILDRSP
jgi:hypothetical protein